MSPDTLPTYIPLDQAATRYGVNVAVLHRAVESGIMRAVKTPEGRILVADEDVAVVAAQAKAKNTGDELVSISEAARRLNINSRTICRWESYGWLPVVARGTRRAKLVSWQRAKALGSLYHERSQRGSRLIPQNKMVTDVLSMSA